tara:strand:- start:10136 stop:10585 length:450 start_codon:yes stop_codon:yes gene_type:complete
MPSMLVATGLLEGICLSAVLYFGWNSEISLTSFIPPSAMILILFNSFLWRRYARNAKKWGISPIDRNIIGSLSPKLYTFGHIIPLILFGIAFFIPNTESYIVCIASLFALIGSIFWKATIITRACHMQNFALGKMPHRGSGKFAAPNVN